MSGLDRGDMRPESGLVLDKNNEVVDLVDPNTKSKKTTEQLKPVAEDNKNGVFAMVKKPLGGSDYKTRQYKNLGSNVTAVVLAAPGTIYAVQSGNGNNDGRYIQLFDRVDAPNVGDEPLWAGLVNGNDEETFDSIFGMNGREFKNGIVFAFSTDRRTYQPGLANDQDTFIDYIEKE